MITYPNCAKCTPRRVCEEHADPSYVMRDGERTRVPMMFRDSVQREIAASMPNAHRAQALADHEAWKRQQVSDADLSDAARTYEDQMRPHYDRVAATNAAIGQRMVADAAEAAQRVRGYADAFKARDEERDAAARKDDNGYSAMCDRLQYDPTRTRA